MLRVSAVESQLLAMDSATNRAQILILADDAPAIWATRPILCVPRGSRNSVEATMDRLLQTRLKATDRWIQNGYRPHHSRSADRVHHQPSRPADADRSARSLRNRHAAALRRSFAAISCRLSTISPNNGTRGTSIPISRNNIGIWIKPTK